MEDKRSHLSPFLSIHSIHNDQEVCKNHLLLTDTQTLYLLSGLRRDTDSLPWTRRPHGLSRSIHFAPLSVPTSPRYRVLVFYIWKPPRLTEHAEIFLALIGELFKTLFQVSWYCLGLQFLSKTWYSRSFSCLMNQWTFIDSFSSYIFCIATNST